MLICQKQDSYIDLLLRIQHLIDKRSIMTTSESSRPQSAAPPNGAADAALWVERHTTAYQIAWREIEALQPGELVPYHEGHLAADIVHDAAAAGRAAAFWDAALEQAKGTLTQRRLRSERYQYIFRRSPT